MLLRRTFPFAAALLSAAAFCLGPIPAAFTQTQSDLKWTAVNGRLFRIPLHTTLRQAASTALVSRPISADWDHQGRLYVSESSGTNANVQLQASELPHRILRLSDQDGDGVFDHRTVFADRMMFPEGVLWHDGSLYVAAPPNILKLTDTDDDGVADQHAVWMAGSTITGCANDTHGPYLGRDGWLYWCKGAFARQTHQVAGKTWTTAASHVFRRRPEGGPLEPVLTGGMDNPVELTFSPEGERFLDATFLVHPNTEHRDGIVHAIYGGVYGKDHGVLDEHPRTGPLMPILQHLGPAAPSGLAWTESNAIVGARRLLFTCFNLRKVGATELIANGASYRAATRDLLVCDDLDFHPTDVLEAPNGDLLVIDTGGWYKLCCPTSQLHKPDVLGAIYRLSPLRSDDADTARKQPLGQDLDWNDASPAALVERLGDSRPFVRRRALESLGAHEDQKAAVAELRQALQSRQSSAAHRLQCVWGLCRVDDDAARQATHAALSDPSPRVVHAALHAVSVWRDRSAGRSVLSVLQHSNDPRLRRAAAEALGRMGGVASARVIADVLRETEPDRVLHHSLAYALLEGAASESLHLLRNDRSPRVRRAVLFSLDWRDELTWDDVRPALADASEEVREVAWAAVLRREYWRTHYVETLRSLWSDTALGAPATVAEALARTRAALDLAEAQRLLSEVLERKPDAETAVAIAEMLQAARPDLAKSPLLDTILAGLQRGSAAEQAAWVRTLLACAPRGVGHRKPPLDVLQQIADSPEHSPRLRLDALRLLALSGRKEPSSESTEFVLACLSPETPIGARTAAADLTAMWPWSDPGRQKRLAEALGQAGPFVLPPLLNLLPRIDDEAFIQAAGASLRANPAAASVPRDHWTRLAEGGSPRLRAELSDLIEQAQQAQATKLQKIDAILPLIAAADPRNGQRVFQSRRAACSACHRLGYVGGDIGPNLRRIGAIRSERDLLESILFPSVSFVRSFHPEDIVTADGRVFSGICRDEGDHLLVVAGPDKVQRIQKSAIERRTASKTSIMPAGVDRLLSPQELADLVAFLKQAN